MLCKIVNDNDDEGGVCLCCQITWPYLWQPQIVDVQLFMVGQLAIILPPAEFT